MRPSSVGIGVLRDCPRRWFLNFGQLSVIDRHALEQEFPPGCCSLYQYLGISLRHYGHDVNHLFKAENGGRIVEEWKCANVRDHLEDDRRDTEDIGQFEEPGDGVFFDISYIVLLVGQ